MLNTPGAVPAEDVAMVVAMTEFVTKNDKLITQLLEKGLNFSQAMLEAQREIQRKEEEEEKKRKEQEARDPQ